MIKHYKEPRVVRLDGRYKLFNAGFKYRIEFNTQGDGKWQHWLSIADWCKQTWGKEFSWEKGVNPNYRTDVPDTNRHFRFLYLKTEKDVTMLLLVVGA